MCGTESEADFRRAFGELSVAADLNKFVTYEKVSPEPPEEENSNMRSGDAANEKLSMVDTALHGKFGLIANGTLGGVVQLILDHRRALLVYFNIATVLILCSAS